MSSGMRADEARRTSQHWRQIEPGRGRRGVSPTVWKIALTRSNLVSSYLHAGERAVRLDCGTPARNYN